MTFIFLLFGCTSEEPIIDTSPATENKRTYTHTDLQQNCISSCSVQDDTHKELPEDEWLQNLETWSMEPLGEATLALETLLFYADQSLALLPMHEYKLNPDWDEDVILNLFSPITKFTCSTSFSTEILQYFK